MVSVNLRLKFKANEIITIKFVNRSRKEDDRYGYSRPKDFDTTREDDLPGSRRPFKHYDDPERKYHVKEKASTSKSHLKAVTLPFIFILV